jgi:asparagine synthase (glutamine-hydrolysing)
LDNDLVALAFRVPRELAENVGLQLRLIAAGNPVISKIGTDRALLYESVPWMTKLEHLYQEFIFKAEYAYDYGMPQWLAKADHWFEPFHLERLFLGRHKFYHFRVWYRDELSPYVKDILLDSRTRARPYLQGPMLEKMVRDHTRGIGNHTSEIHRILTSELMHRQLIDRN